MLFKKGEPGRDVKGTPTSGRRKWKQKRRPLQGAQCFRERSGSSQAQSCPGGHRPRDAHAHGPSGLSLTALNRALHIRPTFEVLSRTPAGEFFLGCLNSVCENPNSLQKVFFAIPGTNRMMNFFIKLENSDKNVSI